MPTPAQIATSWGMQNADAAVEAARATGLELAAAFAMLQKESGGRNAWGSDVGGVFAGRKGDVTEADYRSFRKKIDAGGKSQGVGPTQITYKGFFPLMEKRGLKPWVPLDNMQFGFELLAGYRKAYGSWELAGVAYNSGPGTAAKGTVTAYGLTFAKHVTEWRDRLAAAEPDESEEGPVARKTWRGKTFDARTVEMLVEAEKLSGLKIVVTQGSYNSSVAASADTHKGGGAADLSVREYSEAEEDKLIHALRTVGFAAWERQPPKFDEHIHAIAIGCSDLSPGAAKQVKEYLAGGDGLVGSAPDGNAYLKVKPTTWEQYKAKRDAKPSDPKPESKPAPGTKPPVDPKDPKPGSRTVKNGSKGPDVAYIQRFRGITADGVFGDKTEESVRRYQRMRGLVVDGVVGPETWKHLLGKAGQ